MSQESSDQQVRFLTLKAARSLDAARQHIERGDYDFASSRAYYAAFYVIEGLLLKDNLAFSKHSAVIAAFNQHYIKPGVFPKEFSTFVARLFRQRQIGDYEFELSIDRDGAVHDVQIAETIVDAVAAYLSSRGVGDTEPSTGASQPGEHDNEM